MGHPVQEWKIQARAQADRFGREVEFIWWKEYRDAYAQASGLGEESPVAPDGELQTYLRGLDEKVQRLRAAYRAKLVES